MNSFDGDIYSVYHDDAAAGKLSPTSISTIRSLRIIPVLSSFMPYVSTESGGQTSGEYLKRGVNCADLDGSEEGHIKDLRIS